MSLVIWSSLPVLNSLRRASMLMEAVLFFFLMMVLRAVATSCRRRRPALDWPVVRMVTSTCRGVVRVVGSRAGQGGDQDDQGDG